MKKVAVYGYSRTFPYEAIQPSLKSLLMNGGIDQVYILAEDNDLGIPLPPRVSVINMSLQNYFPPDGPNYHSHFTYMSLMQAALPKIFPTFDRILNIDVDTIVIKSLADLWDLPMDDYYLAAVPEPELSAAEGYMYVNTGVAFFNLAKLRDDGKDDEIIESLNTKKWRYVNQDCINELCRGKILALPVEYNASVVTGMTSDLRIRHFARIPTSEWYNKNPLVQVYRR